MNINVLNARRDRQFARFGGFAVFGVCRWKKYFWVKNWGKVGGFVRKVATFAL